MSSDWKRAADNYSAEFSLLQQHLPTHALPPAARLLIWRNRRFLHGHNRWLVQLLRATDWSDAAAAAAAHAFLMPTGDAGNSLPCSRLGCAPRKCRPVLQPEDALELMSGFAPVLYAPVRDILAATVTRATPARLLLFLPLLIDALQVRLERKKNKVFFNNACMSQHSSSCVE